MKLVPITELLADARKNHYAIGAFNVVNMETVQAVARAAEAEKTPVIIQIWHGDMAHAGGRYISAITKAAAESFSIPLALNLDHGQSYEQVVECINWGFSAVMIDLASNDFYENIKSTRKVVEFAHAKGVSVEAELGQIFDAQSPVSQRNSALTDPDQAVEFVAKTGVDALAVSIGTAHGMYSSKPVIDFELLEKLVQMVKIPIVVHGGSNNPDEDIVNMVRLGVAKINIGTDLMNAFTQGMRESLASGDPAPRDILGHARECVEAVTRKKIRLLNTLRSDR